MTAYENLKELDKQDLLMKSIRNGIISPVYLDYIEIYEMFLKLRNKGNYKMQCYYDIAFHMCISVDNVRKVIYKMKS